MQRHISSLQSSTFLVLACGSIFPPLRITIVPSPDVIVVLAVAAVVTGSYCLYPRARRGISVRTTLLSTPRPLCVLSHSRNFGALSPRDCTVVCHSRAHSMNTSMLFKGASPPDSARDGLSLARHSHNRGVNIWAEYRFAARVGREKDKEREKRRKRQYQF